MSAALCAQKSLGLAVGLFKWPRHSLYSRAPRKPLGYTSFHQLLRAMGLCDSYYHDFTPFPPIPRVDQRRLAPPGLQGLGAMGSSFRPWQALQFEKEAGGKKVWPGCWTDPQDRSAKPRTQNPAP